ncbi:MAG: hypothetical protein ACK5U5_03230 [Burkholderiales bacterium]
MENKIVFVDRIESAGISAGVVRLNFSTEIPQQVREAGKEPEHTLELQLVLPIVGFAQSFRLLENLVQQVRAANNPAAAAEAGGDAVATSVVPATTEESTASAASARRRPGNNN